MIHISACWFIIKCIDYSLSELQSSRKYQQKFMDMASYVFYFPCFHLGPFIPYGDFKEVVYLPFEAWTYSRAKTFILNILRYFGWMMVFELASHYFYCNALHYQASYLLSKGAWTFNGVGYCMGQFFFIKYTAIYGLMGTLARAERYKTPPHPRCIHWVYRYSDMWRHFDRGFYLFIFRCIYKPLCGDFKPTWKRKLYASFLSFCFVFIWHGGNLTIFYWSIFNFIGITLEVAGKLIGELQSVKLWKTTYLSESNIRRLNGLWSAPLWIFAVISNFIFFGGHELGLMHIKQFMFGPWQLSFCIVTISYCMCQVSMEITLWMFLMDEKYKYISLKKKI
ncbi:hypothetical protein AAG570_012678 [Ranatra chinensis]|uniref:Protein-cysteine N-palmitoyltransferase Rasp n=1 Tax=Ranatra chinensis TaxID=642074 RepID=A0ABD0Z2U4_9HEMI